MSEMYSELFRSRMVLLTLGSNNSFSTFQDRSLINNEMTITFPDEACAVTRVHGNHICC